MICKKCKNKFPSRIIIDGKERNLGNRKYCLNCSPFGKHNTKKLDDSKRKERDKNIELVGSYRRRNSIRAKEYLGNKCLICGYEKCIQALEFHHLIPEEKRFFLASNFNKKWEYIVKELDKCILLCSNCHREVEYGLCDSIIEEIIKSR